MGKLKVHELAKELGLESKQLIAKANEVGIEVTSHLSSLEEEQVNKIMQNQELEPNEKVLEVMNLIGRKRGAIISGGEIDIEKVANIIIDDFRSGRLGRITLETVKGE